MKNRASRLPPLAPDEWNEKTRAILGATVAPVSELEGKEPEPKSGGPLNILRVIAHHPRLLEPFLGFAAALAAQGTLPRRASELLALRAAWNCSSPFEWGHHVIYARAAGLDESEIERIARDPGHPDWTDEERTLLVAADELHAGYDLSDETWGLLRTHWNEAQLLEIPFVVGQYTMLSMVANSTGVPLEDDLPKMPEKAG